MFGLRGVWSKPEPSKSGPHPAMAMFAAPKPKDEAAPAPVGRYGDCRAELAAEAETLDSPEIGKARALSGTLGQAFVDRLVAGRVAGNLAVVFGVLAAFGLGAGLWSFFGAPAAATDAGLAAATLALGGALAALLGAVFRGRGLAAGRSLEATAAELETVVRETSGRFQDELTPRRARMLAGAAARDALSAAAETRRLTASAVRFLENAPLVGDAGAAPCARFAADLQAAGRQRRAAAGGAVIAATAAIIGAVLLVVVLGRTSVSAPSLAALAGAYPLSIASALFVALLLPGAILSAAHVFGRAAAESPERLMAQEPARSLVASLSARLGAAVAEPAEALVERYAEAMGALEGRVAAQDSLRSVHAESAALETPYWRRKPEGPRFVDTAFQAAPKAFLRDDGAPAAGGRLPGTAPKRRLFRLPKPPGL